jgi:hypothetical protein
MRPVLHAVLILLAAFGPAAGAGAQDADGDGTFDAEDCAPADPSARHAPGEVPLLLVRGLPGAALLTWTDGAASWGTGTRYGVISGALAGLHADRGTAGASLVAPELPVPSWLDARPPGGERQGHWHLVRASNACGFGPAGEAELDAGRPFDEGPLNCDGGMDEDGDGLVDCAEPACADPACPEDCSNALDDDADGLADCADLDCAGPACPEDCSNAADDDADGLTDCEDPDCPGCPEDCAVAGDEDSDGLADCLDPDCSAACPEDCLNGLDDDADGLVDCDAPECAPSCCDSCRLATQRLQAPDAACRTHVENGACFRRFFRVQLLADRDSIFSTCGDCGAFAGRDTILRLYRRCEVVASNDDCASTAVGESELRYRPAANGEHVLEVQPRVPGPWAVSWRALLDAEDCSSPEDDDGDGLLNCDDPTCPGRFPCVETCTGGLDEDRDGLIDCDDPNCMGHSACRERCTGGVDDDRDGFVDCLDPDCIPSRDCPEICDDGIDNDADGAVDCADPSCSPTPCPEICGDMRDNDGDGLPDCRDPDCFSPACPEACTGAFDEDVDGLTDCDDDDCSATYECCEHCASAGLPRLEPRVACRQRAGDTLACGATAYELLLEAGNRYVFSTCRDCGGDTSMDTILVLTDPSCAVVARNDSWGACSSFGGSEIWFEPAVTGRHVLQVQGWGGQRGSYELGYRIETCNATGCAEALACGDGLDNDGDGPADCLDPDCTASAACPESAHCLDGVDNDGDGIADCLDDDCFGTPGC